MGQLLGKKTILNEFVAYADIPKVQDIMSERRIELAFEGHRFFDLKRSNSGFDRSANDCAAASGACSITSTDHRWVLPIPQEEIFANDNIKQNPNYDSN